MQQMGRFNVNNDSFSKPPIPEYQDIDFTVLENPTYKTFF